MTPESLWQINKDGVLLAIRDTPTPTTLDPIYDLSAREMLIARIAFKCGALVGQRENKR
jgi:hypothetical protein